jgi:hypothetical protein
MAFTYGGNPANSSREAVRWLIGDTDSNDAIFNDAEIDYVLSENGSNVYKAAPAAALIAAAKFARKADKAVGDLRLSLHQKFKQYIQLSEELQDKFTSEQNTPIPLIGGISISAINSVELDTDREPTAFKIKQFDHSNGDDASRVADWSN